MDAHPLAPSLEGGVGGVTDAHPLAPPPYREGVGGRRRRHEMWVMAVGRTSDGGVRLTELLAFVAVLALVGALVVPRMLQSSLQAHRERAARDIQALSEALDKYRIDNGRYPSTKQGIEALRTEPKTSPPPRHWDGPYLDRAIPVDPWGNDYVYTCPGEHNPKRFDLLSRGADGKKGGQGEDADIGNWEWGRRRVQQMIPYGIPVALGVSGTGLALASLGLAFVQDVLLRNRTSLWRISAARRDENLRHAAVMAVASEG